VAAGKHNGRKFVMCECVCVCMGSVMCGCFENCVRVFVIYLLVFIVFCIVYTVFVLFSLCIFIFIFFCLY
jgi:hypothetical protein